MAHLTRTAQFSNGKQAEAFLDDYFRGRGCIIEVNTPYEERRLHLGDRRFYLDGQSFYVEYKSGVQTAYTGNIFLETVSVDSTNTEGWVYTCQADLIFYACLLNDKILVFRPERLRAEIEYLKRQFREVKTSHGQNAGYNTHGVLVPLEYAERYLAERVIALDTRTSNQ